MQSTALYMATEEEITAQPYSSSTASPSVYSATPTDQPHTSTAPFFAQAVSIPPLYQPHRRHRRDSAVPRCFFEVLSFCS